VAGVKVTSYAGLIGRQATGFSEVNRLSNQTGPAQLFDGLLPKSRAMADFAQRIRETPGVDAWLAMYIPLDVSAPVEVMVATGPWGMSITPQAFSPAAPRSTKR
jgi:hypothetical protein